MTLPRTSIVATLVATAALATTGPSARAQSVVGPGTLPGVGATPGALGYGGGGDTMASGAAGPCGTANGNIDQGPAGQQVTQVCQGSGLTFVGPSIGQVATVIGPTIISPAFNGAVNVSAGNGSIG